MTAWKSAGPRLSPSFVSQNTFDTENPADIMTGVSSLLNPDPISGKPRHLAGGGRLQLRTEES